MASAAAATTGVVKVGAVWWALKEEAGKGEGALVLPEYWQLFLLVAHLNREAAAADASAAAAAAAAGAEKEETEMESAETGG